MDNSHDIGIYIYNLARSFLSKYSDPFGKFGDFQRNNKFEKKL